jgi:uncharacterized protein (DUF362 family)
MIGRRDIIKAIGGLFYFIISGCLYKKEREPLEPRGRQSTVYVVQTTDRGAGVRGLLDQFDLGTISGKRVALKANYNSDDPFPASTHIDTLSAIVDTVDGAGAGSITLPERSGMGGTRNVLENLGVIDMAQEKEVEIVVLDELSAGDYVHIQPEDSHWKRGFLMARSFSQADAIIQTCCLKTHRFGGQFTMALKNSVGMVAKFDPDDGYNYMNELHMSTSQREKIAEINTAYDPLVVIMDAIQGFSDGGPDTGTLIEPGIMAASTDRIALDAVGVAILRMYGTTRAVRSGPIFDQDQIRRAAELGLGARGSEDVEVVAVNDGAEDICGKIRKELTSV